MADFKELIQEINEKIKTNGTKSITGAKMNEVLRDMVAAVDALKQDILLYYTEWEDNASIITQGRAFIKGSDSASVESAGYKMEVNEENGIRIGKKNEEFYLDITNYGVEIKTTTLEKIKLNHNGFMVELFDGSDPYRLTFDLNNGLFIGEINVLHELESLQEQIDELKNS